MLNYPKETPPAALLNYPEIPARAAHLYPFPTRALQGLRIDEHPGPYLSTT